MGRIKDYWPQMIALCGAAGFAAVAIVGWRTNLFDGSGTLAEWAAAVATFLAVWVALHLSLRETVAQRQRSADMFQMLIELVRPEAIALLQQLGAIQGMLGSLEKSSRDPDELRLIREHIYSVSMRPTLVVTTSNVKDLIDLGLVRASAVSRLIGSSGLLSSALSRARAELPQNEEIVRRAMLEAHRYIEAMVADLEVLLGISETTAAAIMSDADALIEDSESAKLIRDKINEKHRRRVDAVLGRST